MRKAELDYEITDYHQQRLIIIIKDTCNYDYDGDHNNLHKWILGSTNSYLQFFIFQDGIVGAIVIDIANKLLHTYSKEYH